MIRSFLIATAALAVAACGGDGPTAGNDASGEEEFTREAIVANDITAIDAATSDAANMAADVAPEIEEGNDLNAASEPEAEGNRG